MEICVEQYLEGKGYQVNKSALEVIEQCDNWYASRSIEDFHNRKNLNGEEIELQRMNFAKRCCADDANLCEIVSVTPEKETKSETFIQEVLDGSRFDVLYRRQLEKVSALGTAGAYIYLQNATYTKKGDTVTISGGKIKINYCDADCIIPLTTEDDLVTECAFSATNLVRGKKTTTLVIFTKDDAGRYVSETAVFDKDGKLLESTSLQLGEVKPFAIMQNAEVNNIDNMDGYGLPKILNAIPTLMLVDLCYNLLNGDLSKGDKLLFLNELLAMVKTDKDGNPKLTKQQKEIFILLGDKLPDQDTLIKEYNPEIRVEQITKAFELALSLLSMSFGYGTKKYTFENGQVKTATEYIGTKQDAMQELNKQRKQAVQYIEDLIHAAMWFSNEFNKTNYDVKEPLMVEFDDSYITDKETELERVRNDALSFDIPKLTIMYLMKAYNIPEEEAVALVEEKPEEPVLEDED